MKNFNRRLLVFSASALFLIPSFGQGNKNVLDLKYSIEDSAIVFPESYESDTQRLLERWYLKNYTTTDLESTSPNDPGASDNEIRERLAALPTIIDMPFNGIVKSYIERYTKSGRKQVTALLGLSTYYMPIFEQALEEYGLPLELKYLPIIESGLDPCATSKSGAAGLWQFMPATARGHQMELSTLVDERRDPYISSEKACELLKSLYDIYGDWSLAIAAYNCGSGTVNKALKRAGGDTSTHDFWSIYYYLPEETRGYVPMFIAANYVMNYYPEHDIAPVLPTKPLITDTIHVRSRVHFEQIAAVLDIPIDEIRILNPQFRQDIIPASADRPYNLTLPSQQIHAYIVSEDQILAYEESKYARRLEATPGDANVTAVEMVADEPLNPSDPAPVEAAAAQLAYEETHPSQTATPTRRRSTATAPAQAQAQAAPAATTVSASANTASRAATSAATANQPAATPKKSETNAKQSAAAAKKNTAAANSTAATATKATNKSANQTKANQTKAKETAATNTKKNTKGNNNTKSKPKNTEHSVASGENLTTIAKKHGVSVEELKKANPKIKTDLIHPGDKITVPSKSSAKSNTKNTTNKNTSTASKSTSKKKKK